MGFEFTKHGPASTPGEDRIWVEITGDTDANSSGVNELWNPFDEDESTGFTSTTHASSSAITYTSTDGRFTINTAGTYSGVVNIIHTAATGTPLGTLHLYKNGSSVQSFTVTIHSTVDPQNIQLPFILESLAATDYLEVYMSTDLTTMMIVKAGSSFQAKRIAS